MVNLYRIRNFKIGSPFNSFKPQIKKVDQRISDVIEKGLINVIFVDGRSQSGKSTYADNKIKCWDPNYTLVYNAEDIFKLLERYKTLLKIDSEGHIGKPENINLILWKWILFEEPQNQLSKKFWDERTTIITQLTSTWGFLKNQLVLTMPDCAGLPKIPTIMINLTCKITIKMFLKNHVKIRRYYVYIPHKNYRTENYFWGSAVESGLIPELQLSPEYFEKKYHNFFNVQMKKWEEDLHIERRKNEFFIKRENKPLPLNIILDLYKQGRIDKEHAFEEVVKNGYGFTNTDLILESVVPSA
jgi:hypothetical protein